MFSQKNPKEDKKGHLLGVNIYKDKNIFFFFKLEHFRKKHAFSTKCVL